MKDPTAAPQEHLPGDGALVSPTATLRDVQWHNAFGSSCTTGERQVEDYCLPLCLGGVPGLEESQEKFRPSSCTQTAARGSLQEAEGAGSWVRCRLLF